MTIFQETLELLHDHQQKSSTSRNEELSEILLFVFDIMMYITG